MYFKFALISTAVVSLFSGCSSMAISDKGVTSSENFFPFPDSVPYMPLYHVADRYWAKNLSSKTKFIVTGDKNKVDEEFSSKMKDIIESLSYKFPVSEEKVQFAIALANAHLNLILQAGYRHARISGMNMDYVNEAFNRMVLVKKYQNFLLSYGLDSDINKNKIVNDPLLDQDDVFKKFPYLADIYIENYRLDESNQDFGSFEDENETESEPDIYIQVEPIYTPVDAVISNNVDSTIGFITDKSGLNHIDKDILNNACGTLQRFKHHFNSISLMEKTIFPLDFSVLSYKVHAVKNFIPLLLKPEVLPTYIVYSLHALIDDILLTLEYRT